MEGAHILVIEDDHDIAHLIALHLGEVGFKVAVVHDSLDGLERATEGSHDLIVLDVMLARLSGTELCQRLRAASNDLLILMLSARGAEIDRVLGLEIDVQNRAVTLTGRPLHLTLKEFDLLAQFAGHPGRVYTRTQLLNAVWGYGYDGLEHTVNSHINRLRSELERDPANPDYIQTVWGVGYRFAPTQA